MLGVYQSSVQSYWYMWLRSPLITITILRASVLMKSAKTEPCFIKSSSIRSTRLGRGEVRIMNFTSATIFDSVFHDNVRWGKQQLINIAQHLCFLFHILSNCVYSNLNEKYANWARTFSLQCFLDVPYRHCFTPAERERFKVWIVPNYFRWYIWQSECFANGFSGFRTQRYLNLMKQTPL